MTRDGSEAPRNQSRARQVEEFRPGGTTECSHGREPVVRWMKNRIPHRRGGGILRSRDDQSPAMNCMIPSPLPGRARRAIRFPRVVLVADSSLHSWLHPCAPPGREPAPYTSRMMRRWILRSLLCLLLGAITTIAVAWGIAYFGSWEIPLLPDEAELVFHAEDRLTDHVIVSRWSHFGTTTVWVTKGLGGSGMISEADLGEIAPAWCAEKVQVRRLEPMGTSQRAWSFFEGRGWPAVALSCEQRGLFVTPAAGAQQAGIIGGIETDRPTTNINVGQYIQPFRILPYVPIWPGLVINTLFYAAIWFGVFFGFTGAKRFLRAKRGRCPRCGYDLRGQRMEESHPHPNPLPPSRGGSIRCPECGWGRIVQPEGLRDSSPGQRPGS